MLSSRISDPERCPSARPLGVAILHGHELKWHKVSRKDGSGKCDIVEGGKDSLVYGVLYDIDEAQRNNLDRAEGCGHGYDRKEVEVVHGESRVKACVYYATAIDAKLKPYDWYKALVIAGAKEHNLPQAYISQLESVKAVTDTDVSRAASNYALLNINERKA